MSVEHKETYARFEAENKLLMEENRRLTERESDYRNARKAMILMLEDLNRTSEAVIRAKNELEAAFDSITDPLFIHDGEFRIVNANSAYSRYAGTTDFMGRPYYEVFPKMDQPFSFCIESSKGSGEVAKEDEEVTVPSLGKIFKIRYYPIKDGNGAFLYSIHILEDITAAKMMEERLKEEMGINASLLSIAEATIATKDLDRLMMHVVESVGVALKADICLTYLKEAKGYSSCQATGLARGEMSQFKTESLPDGLRFIRKAIETNEPFISQVPFPEEIMAGPCPFSWIRGVSTMLVIPLVSRVGPVGLIVVFFKDGRAIGEAEKKIIKGISTQVSSAVEEARLYRETVEKAAELSHKIETIKVMNEIDRSILSTLDPGEILETVVRLLAKVLPCERASIIFVDRERGGFTYQTGFGIDVEKGFFMPFGVTSTTTVVETGMLQFVPDLRTVEDLLPFEKRLLGDGFLSHIRVPIIVKGEMTAVLNIGAKRAGVFTGEDISTLEKLAFQVGVALENSRLIKDLEDMHLSTLKTLSRAIDAKSPWTHGHSERVTLIALDIARKMGLKDKELKTLEVAGLLHDIGKLGTYEAVLDKPGKLTEEEVKVMKMHPGKGAEIIEPIKQLRDIIPAIKYHHEYYDGTGYPEGLKCESIPLLARIISVADTVDAMGADRPYRKGRPLADIVKELQRCSGTQFDPRVVTAFLDISSQLPMETT